MLVDACIARVRATARLDDDAVLPPLPRIVPRRDVVILAKPDTAEAMRLATIAAAAQDAEKRGAGARARSRPSSRLALALCGLVAVSAASAAFLASPAGARHRPAVERASGAATSVANALEGAARAAFWRVTHTL